MTENTTAKAETPKAKADERVTVSASVPKSVYDKLVDKRWERRDNTLADTARAAFEAFVS